MTEFRPTNQETDPELNREPGIVIVEGSNLQKEMRKWEQFPSKWTGSAGPGNPYTYRPFPKMLYRAEHWQGAIRCMAAPPDPGEFKDPREFERAEAAAAKFTEKCQKVVNDDREYQMAMESGWRESAKEATEHLEQRDRDYATLAAQRNYEDRNMSEPAKREIAKAVEAAEGHVAEIPEKKRRGRPRKNPAAA